MGGKGPPEGKTVKDVLDPADAPEKTVPVQRGHLLAESSAGRVQKRAAQKNMGWKLLGGQIPGQGDDAYIGKVFIGFRRNDEYRSAAGFQGASLSCGEGGDPQFKGLGGRSVGDGISHNSTPFLVQQKALCRTEPTQRLFCSGKGLLVDISFNKRV